MTRSTKIAVAGATGRAGRQVVDILESRGYDVVPISRSQGVDVITGEGLDEALTGVETIIDVSTGPSPDQQAATEFFTTSTRNLQEAGEGLPGPAIRSTVTPLGLSMPLCGPTRAEAPGLLPPTKASKRPTTKQ